MSDAMNSSFFFELGVYFFPLITLLSGTAMMRNVYFVRLQGEERAS